MGAPLEGDSTDKNVAAVLGRNTAGGDGVKAVGTSGNGLSAFSTDNVGVYAHSTNKAAIYATADNDVGVVGINTGQGKGANDGVRAVSTNGNGLSAFSTNNVGVYAHSTNKAAIYATADNDVGVVGINTGSGRGANDAIRAVSTNGNGLAAFSTNGTGIYGRGGQLAAFFEGGVRVHGELFVDGNVRIPKTGDLIIEGADCAEQFDFVDAAAAAPGSVVAIGADGALEECARPYDKRVAGVVSGAGAFKPGIVLDKRGDETGRRPIALVGKVFCKVDARFAPIEVGDLLTSSATPGHAMKATDPARAFGAVIGKALQPLACGVGLIPILVALQ